MSQYYDKMRDQFYHEPAEKKLSILRAETRTPLAAADGYLFLMKALIEERNPQELPDKFLKWLDTITENISTVQDCILALTDEEHRSKLNEHK